MKSLLLTLITFGALQAQATNYTPGDYLVKVTPEAKEAMMMTLQSATEGSKVNDLGFKGWIHVTIPEEKAAAFNFMSLQKEDGVLHVQPNYRVKMLENPALLALKAQQECPPGIPKEICDILFPPGGGGNPPGPSPGDNPAIPRDRNTGSGADPLLTSQWGMNDIGVEAAWQVTPGNPNIVVAVIDTGVDYTHEDLRPNLWNNPGETGTDAQGRDKATNGVDDDSNGFVDDVIGWDFASNDNKPYDLTASVMSGGNPGHGTHCAGNVAARGNNGTGISGVAPNVKIMAIRFLTEKGSGTIAGAIGSIKYAYENGAHITSNSWGSEGNPNDTDPDNVALKDVIQESQNRGVLFIAAAGNGRGNGFTPPKGFDNDTDSKPALPASYNHDIIVSVSAIDINDNLGSFSNFGQRTVDIAAPGVKIFSTVPGNQYQDSINAGGQTVTWDGTSMATPHVSGAAALYLSKHPNATWREVKAALISSAAKVSNLSNKNVAGGKLDVQALMNQ